MYFSEMCIRKTSRIRYKLCLDDSALNNVNKNSLKIQNMLIRWFFRCLYLWREDSTIFPTSINFWMHSLKIKMNIRKIWKNKLLFLQVSLSYMYSKKSEYEYFHHSTSIEMTYMIRPQKELFIKTFNYTNCAYNPEIYVENW